MYYVALLTVPVLVACTAMGQTSAPAKGGRIPLLTSADAWKKLPRAEKGSGKPLPVWARALTRILPHTTAAMLELDYTHRACSPLPAKLRARMRWTAARALGCAYGQAQAAADLLRAGATPEQIRALSQKRSLPEAERLALDFAHRMAIDPHLVTDREVARLIQLHGEKQVVAMVLLSAYAGFQDRLLLALDLPAEADGVLEPVEFRFAPVPLGTSLAAPRKGAGAKKPPPSRLLTRRDDPDLLPEALQKGLEAQRQRQPRIKLPTDETGRDIYWGAVCRAYQPRMAAAWAACRKAFGAEANQDPVFEISVFWLLAQRQKSFY